MATSGRKDYHSKNIKKAAKDIPSKAKEAAGAVRDAVRGQAAAVHDSARHLSKAIFDAAKENQDKAKAAVEGIKEGSQDLSRDARHAARGVSDELKK